MEQIIGIGMDQIEIGRVTKAVQKGSFLHRYYSKREQGIIGKRLTSAATNFAGKEAVVKAKIYISLSDSRTMAAAFAVAVGKAEKMQEE